MSQPLNPPSRPSLWAQFQKECFGSEVLEDENSFIHYRIAGNVVHIIDIFTVKEARRTGEFYRLCRQVHEIAKKCGCTKAVSYLNMDCKTATQSLRAQLAMGMKLGSAQGRMIFLEKDI